MKRIIVWPIMFIMFSGLVTGCRVQSGAPEPFLTTDYFESGSYRLEMTYPSEAVEFGSTVEVELRIKYPEGESFILLPPGLETAERYSNTLLTDAVESGPVIGEKGQAVSTVVFRLETWLPGELIFPSVTVRFEKELSTDEIVIRVASGFDSSEEPHDLAPLYIPSNDQGLPLWSVILIAVLAAASAAAVVLIRRRGKRKSKIPAVENTAELLNEFRKKYIEADGEIDLSAAFAALQRITDIDVDVYQQRMINEIRFSQDFTDYDAGLTLLQHLFGGVDDI